MRYKKEDLVKLEKLVKEVNKLISENFACNLVEVKQLTDKTIKIDVYVRASALFS